MVFGKGIKIWCILCIIISALASILNCVVGVYDLGILGLVSCVVYIMLLVQKKKIAFYSIIVLAIIILVLNMVKYNVGILSALTGLFNPIITFVFLSKYWKQM